MKKISSKISQIKQNAYKMNEVSLFVSNRGIGECSVNVIIENLSQLAFKRYSIEFNLFDRLVMGKINAPLLPCSSFCADIFCNWK